MSKASSPSKTFTTSRSAMVDYGQSPSKGDLSVEGSPYATAAAERAEAIVKRISQLELGASPALNSTTLQAGRSPLADHASIRKNLFAHLEEPKNGEGFEASSLRRPRGLSSPRPPVSQSLSQTRSQPVSVPASPTNANRNMIGDDNNLNELKRSVTTEDLEPEAQPAVQPGRTSGIDIDPAVGGAMDTGLMDELRAELVELEHQLLDVPPKIELLENLRKGSYANLRAAGLMNSQDREEVVQRRHVTRTHLIELLVTTIRDKEQNIARLNAALDNGEWESMEDKMHLLTSIDEENSTIGSLAVEAHHLCDAVRVELERAIDLLESVGSGADKESLEEEWQKTHLAWTAVCHRAVAALALRLRWLPADEQQTTEDDPMLETRWRELEDVVARAYRAKQDHLSELYQLRRSHPEQWQEITDEILNTRAEMGVIAAEAILSRQARIIAVTEDLGDGGVSSATRAALSSELWDLSKEVGEMTQRVVDLKVRDIFGVERKLKRRGLTSDDLEALDREAEELWNELDYRTQEGINFKSDEIWAIKERLTRASDDITHYQRYQLERQLVEANHNLAELLVIATRCKAKKVHDLQAAQAELEMEVSVDAQELDGKDQLQLMLHQKIASAIHELGEVSLLGARLLQGHLADLHERHQFTETPAVVHELEVIHDQLGEVSGPASRRLERTIQLLEHHTTAVGGEGDGNDQAPPVDATTMDEADLTPFAHSAALDKLKLEYRELRGLSIQWQLRELEGERQEILQRLQDDRLSEEESGLLEAQLVEVEQRLASLHLQAHQLQHNPNWVEGGTVEEDEEAEMLEAEAALVNFAMPTKDEEDAMKLFEQKRTKADLELHRLERLVDLELQNAREDLARMDQQRRERDKREEMIEIQTTELQQELLRQKFQDTGLWRTEILQLLVEKLRRDLAGSKKSSQSSLAPEKPRVMLDSGSSNSGSLAPSARASGALDDHASISTSTSTATTTTGVVKPKLADLRTKEERDARRAELRKEWEEYHAKKKDYEAKMAEYLKKEEQEQQQRERAANVRKGEELWKIPSSSTGRCRMTRVWLDITSTKAYVLRWESKNKKSALCVLPLVKSTQFFADGKHGKHSNFAKKNASKELKGLAPFAFSIVNRNASLDLIATNKAQFETWVSVLGGILAPGPISPSGSLPAPPLTPSVALSNPLMSSRR